MNAPLTPRDAYLAWQAEIGTEEVVLVQPWIRPRPAAAFPSADPRGGAASPRFNAADSRRFPEESERASGGFTPAFGNKPSPIPAGADFFQSIAEALAKPDPYVKKSGNVETAASAPKSIVSPAPFLPEFQDLEAYWAFLGASCPIWFPGSGSSLVRAEGPQRPVVALVELHPALNAPFEGEAGAFLDKMMKGIGLNRDALYLTSVMKTPPAGKSWARKDVARMVPAVLQELRLAGAGLVVLMGEACAQGVLRTGKSLAALAGAAENQGNMTLVAMEHPALLMHADEAARRAAWTQLKWVRDRLPSVNN